MAKVITTAFGVLGLLFLTGGSYLAAWFAGFWPVVAAVIGVFTVFGLYAGHRATAHLAREVTSNG